MKVIETDSGMLYSDEKKKKKKKSVPAPVGYADASKPVFNGGIYTGLNDSHFQNGKGEGYSQIGNAIAVGTFYLS